jgi:DNA-binding CsgD family transcriptional regulator/DNA-binding transcriptional regulator YiaG
MRRLTPEQAAARGSEEELTDIELEILAKLARGHTIEAIADTRGRSRSTVKTQARELYRKLSAASAAHAVGEGYRRGLLRPDAEAEEVTAKIVDARTSLATRSAWIVMQLKSGLAQRAREEAGASPERVAKLCGVSVPAVHYWERTKQAPSTDGAVNAYYELLRLMIESSLKPDPSLAILK